MREGMDLEANQSMVENLMMKISNWFIMVQDGLGWPILVLIQMVPSSTLL